jgi:AmiR/NasT family two-component response regulator
VANLIKAQASNREIGMAMGVLMSRHRLTQAQAFDLLRMASQHTHRKLREIAAEVVETGMLDFPAEKV